MRSDGIIKLYHCYGKGRVVSSCTASYEDSQDRTSPAFYSKIMVNCCINWFVIYSGDLRIRSTITLTHVLGINPCRTGQTRELMLYLDASCIICLKCC